MPDYPEKGILFRDITPLIGNKWAFNATIDEIASKINKKIDYVAGIEARGFIFAGALACKLDAGVVLIRKKGKLPFKKISEDYDLEYGSESVEMHTDSFPEGSNILIIDDLIATGGTAAAAASLVKRLKGNLSAMVFIIELQELKGIKKLPGINVISLLKY